MKGYKNVWCSTVNIVQSVLSHLRREYYFTKHLMFLEVHVHGSVNSGYEFLIIHEGNFLWISWLAWSTN